MNPLAWKPLRYKIGADDPGSGKLGEIIEVGYDVDVPPPVGLAIAYCNLLDEQSSRRFGPYREQTGTAKQYDEDVPDENGPGFEANLREQFARRRDSGFKYVELDNADAYPYRDVIRATDLAQSYGLGVIAKNPLLLEWPSRWLQHPNVFGVIVEKGAGGPGEMGALRGQVGKPDLPVWFVFFGDTRTRAEAIAEMVAFYKYTGMGVTFDAHKQEYGGEVIDLALPVSNTTQINPEPSMAWRLAKSLVTLRDQIDAMYPGRDKSSDGTIGDAAHAATKSDHNPNAQDVVTAMDITNAPGSGLVARALAETLVASRDPRIKYIISNAQIVSSKIEPWVWRPYSGENAHRAHVHISVMGEPMLYDDARPWELRDGARSTPALQSGKGSWYSQYSGKYEWVDTGDAPGSAALGVPDDAQGISFYDRSTLGKWFEIHNPNGFITIEQQTDIGPHPNTGRLIDISAAAAERMGYTPRNFPTDSVFRWRPAPVPIAVAGLSPQQQAIQYRDLRGTQMPEPQIIPPGQQSAAQIEAIMREAMQAAIQAAMQAALPAIMAAVQQRLGQPLALPAPVVTQPVVDPPKPAPATTPTMQRPSVQAGVLGLVASALLQAFGAIGTPLGMGAEPSTVGTVATLVPAALAATGVTGVWGTLANVGLNLVAGLLKNRLAK